MNSHEKSDVIYSNITKIEHYFMKNKTKMN